MHSAVRKKFLFQNNLQNDKWFFGFLFWSGSKPKYIQTGEVVFSFLTRVILLLAGSKAAIMIDQRYARAIIINFGIQVYRK